LIDTAGIWESKEYLDSLGVEKTMDELKRADICIIVDETNPEKLLRKNFKKHIKDHYVLVKSKIDLDSNSPSKSDNIISTSVKKDKGLNRLLTSLSTYSQLIIGGKGNRLDQVLVTKRQRQLLENSMFFINESINQLDAGVETDIIASTLRSFVISISDVVGEIPNKDVMKNIFNSFCVGK
jgi:tRNA modification GTPase